MFLINANEAFGYTHEQTLDSSFAVIRGMLEEHNYMWRERNKELDKEGALDDSFQWVELPDWVDPTKMNEVKKYKDVVGRIPAP